MSDGNVMNPKAPQIPNGKILHHSNLNDHNADDEYSSSTHTNNSSSSGDLSSDIHQYGSQQPLNIIRPPSYASMMAHNAKNEDYNSSYHH